MPEITADVVKASYKVAKQFYEKEITLSQGVKHLVIEVGMNKSSAVGYIYYYKNLIEGKRFTRTTNAIATRYFLEKMYKDGGRNRLLNALSSLRQHIDYYESVGKSNVVTRRKIYEEFSQLLNISIDDDDIYPDQVREAPELKEGKVRSVDVNIFERNPIARRLCIEHFGCACCICGFDFEVEYGQLGEGFIHVHHEIELSTIGKEYSVDPIGELKPVCPNCHSMLHRRKPAYSIQDIKDRLTNKSKGTR